MSTEKSLAEIEKELAQTKARLAEIERLRYEFASNVSHELRTPLTSMLFAVSNMRRGIVGELPKKADYYLQLLESDCRRMLSTINDILDLGQMANNTITLTHVRTDLCKLLENAVETLQIQADEKRQHLVFNRPPEPIFVVCDPQRIERVAINILGNAVKFTPSGGNITVDVTEKDSHALFCVTDTGIGIPKESLDKVSARYYQAGRQSQGAGLGLAISREIVEVHKGKITIESPAPGAENGTQVTVALPLPRNNE